MQTTSAIQSNNTAAAFNLHSRKIERITYKPSFVRGAVDPDLVRKSKTMSPGNLLLTLSSVALGVAAIGDRFYKFSAEYNDAIVTAILYALPVAMLLGAIAAYRIVNAVKSNERARREALGRKLAEAEPRNNAAAATDIDDDVRVLPARRNLPIAPRFRRDALAA